jgi:hypothetical protein
VTDSLEWTKALVETGRDPQVGSRAVLAVGQEIEAWYRGQLAHRGRVADTLQSGNLFWISDPRTGDRRLLDTDEFSIRPVSGHAENANIPAPMPGPA